jgi:tripartite-type tricarboxylate transporter receptor subunit TctC
MGTIMKATIAFFILAGSTVIGAPATAQSYPAKPVRWIVPLPPGGSTDLISRMIAHPSLPARNVRALVALARTKPNTITYASGGSGGQVHLAVATLTSMAGVQMVHVPYKGIGPALIELISGEVAISLTSIPPSLPHIKTGKLRALGVSSARRFKFLPEVPTISEDGVPGHEVSVWYGVMMPAGTPRKIIARVNAEIVRILGQPDVHERLSGEAGEVVAGTPEAFGAYVRDEIARWTKVITETGVKLE